MLLPTTHNLLLNTYPMSIKVMGHVPPDTDSTCSAIAYAWFLKTHKGLDAQAYIGGEINRETEFVLKHFGVAKPEMISSVAEGDKLVIVDTNNPEELISGYDQAEILEIVDHHKLAGLTTPSPLAITMRPVACVATIIWELAEGKDLPKEIAGIMLASILSDTLKFTSPTTTDADKEAAEVLAKIAGVEVDGLATEMFAAKSNLAGMSARQILMSDQKNFDFGGTKYKVAVLETTDPSQALGMEADLRNEMSLLATEESLAGVFFFVVDILNSSSTLIASNEAAETLAEKAFGSKFNARRMELPGVVSRKKQMVPPLEKAA